MNTPRKIESRPVNRETVTDLLTKYDRPGPRYTSYPTAVEFHDGFGPGDYDARLREANRLGDAPLSIYVHLPFCDERCLFCGCHVIISPHKEVAAPYIGWLKQEASLVADRLPDRRALAQLHLGGGTPTYYPPEALDDLLGHLLSLYRPLLGAELAVEVDPRVTTTDHLDILAEHGFNRISLGVQDLTPEVQKEINRVQSVEQTATLIQHARGLGFRGINVDLIYGLPRQTLETFERTVETVIELGADRAAVYSFAFVPWIRGHQKRLDESLLPSPDTKVSLFAIARERFLEAGYDPIGMDHFAKPDDDLAWAKQEGRLRRNFQGYALIPGEDVLGLGISAIGDVRGAYVQNTKKLSVYQDQLAAGHLPVARGVARTQDDEIRRDLIHELMCNFRVDTSGLADRYGIAFGEYFAEDLALLAPYADEGMVTIADEAIEATPVGELFVRNLAMCFDRYYREKHAKETGPVFSRTV